MLNTFLQDNLRPGTDQLFKGAAAKDLTTLLNGGTIHVYRKGEIVFREGAVPKGIFYLRSGKVKKYKITPHGRDYIFYLCTETELMGCHALLGEKNYPHSAAATEDSEILFITKSQFLGAMRRSPALPLALLKNMGTEFGLYVNALANRDGRIVSERLACHLLLLNEKYKKHGATGTAEITLSRADLACMTGTAIESLVRLLGEFEKQGIIEKDSRSIRIVDMKRLIREANLAGLKS